MKPRNWAGYWSDPEHADTVFGPAPPPVGLERDYAIPVPHPGGIDVAPPEPETHADRVARFGRDRDQKALFWITVADRGPDGWSTDAKIDADVRRIADWADGQNR